ncbi:hypothetical protein [Pseudomonas triticifolii]|uniref:Uncharacterized protein n=1 Tax=Pseudomonas triticifolii TaxID=2762592 RepID=A0ABR7BLS1_9PSED|nr:hypothetical protein [Pseudomonas triticifolii]MBC3958112.1 hypothetical protein [Pseudomonas triticifolii]
MRIHDAPTLLVKFGAEKAKARITAVGVHETMKEVTAQFDEYRPFLIPGRDQHDQKLRAMGCVQSDVTKSLRNYEATGRMLGELPSGLPVPEQYSNLFTWLLNLKREISAQAPDNELFKNPTGLVGYDFPKWREYISHYSADLLPLIDALSERVKTDYAYYEYLTHLGEVAHELVINAKGRSDHLATKLLDLLPTITRPFTQAGREAFELLQVALLSEVDADALVKAGWSPQHSEVIEVACVRSGLHHKAKGPRVEVVRISAYELNYTRLRQAMQREYKAAQEAHKLEREAEVMAGRKQQLIDQADRKDALILKLRAGDITTEELRELEAL